MNNFIRTFCPSYVEGAKCFQSQIESLKLSSVDLKNVGEKTDLRITSPITLHKRPKGICEGFALIFSQYCLQLNHFSYAELKQIRHTVLKRHNVECFFLQHIQDVLLGLHGTPNKDIVKQWSDDIAQIKADDPIINIRRCLIRMSEPSTPNAYATILEIEGIYRAKVCRQEKQFFQLDRDVLIELCHLIGLTTLTKDHFFGTERKLKSELDKLPKGVYHIGVKGHAWVYVVDRERFVCDVNFNISTEFTRTLKSQWITITQLMITPKESATRPSKSSTLSL